MNPYTRGAIQGFVWGFVGAMLLVIWTGWLCQ
jgi:hypothetical protein